MRCTGGMKRVRSKFGGTVKRCRSYGGTSRKRKTYRKRRATGMAKRGSHCKRRKRDYSRVLRKRVWRCAEFSGGRRTKRKGSYRKRTKRKGRRPANKGKQCAQWGIGPSGQRKCMYYEGSPGPSPKSKVRYYGPQQQPGRRGVSPAASGAYTSGARGYQAAQERFFGGSSTASKLLGR